MKSCSRGAHDFENAVRHGRAWYTCPRCGQDISLACGMYYEAVRAERELERLHRSKAKSEGCKIKQKGEEFCEPEYRRDKKSVKFVKAKEDKNE